MICESCPCTYGIKNLGVGKFVHQSWWGASKKIGPRLVDLINSEPFLNIWKSGCDAPTSNI
jgi:hypothetical protein